MPCGELKRRPKQYFEHDKDNLDAQGGVARWKVEASSNPCRKDNDKVLRLNNRDDWYMVFLMDEQK
jgi:hypothetical protein